MTGESISSINGLDTFYNPALMSMLGGYGSYNMSNPMLSSMMMNPAMMMEIKIKAKPNWMLVVTFLLTKNNPLIKHKKAVDNNISPSHTSYPPMT